jgi:hypothetical protein
VFSMNVLPYSIISSKSDYFTYMSLVCIVVYVASFVETSLPSATGYCGCFWSVILLGLTDV